MHNRILLLQQSPVWMSYVRSIYARSHGVALVRKWGDSRLCDVTSHDRRHRVLVGALPPDYRETLSKSVPEVE